MRGVRDFRLVNGFGSDFFYALNCISRRFFLVFLLFLLPFGSLSAAPDGMDMPTPFLTLHAPGKTLELTEEQFLALPQQRLATSTAWTQGVNAFEGPLVRDVLSLLDAEPASTATVTLRAWNDYEVVVSFADYQRWDVILAHSMDGARLSLLDYGPLWVIYPRDDHDELQDSRFDHRWAWTLSSITVNP